VHVSFRLSFALILGLLLGTTGALAQISPGPLAQAHSSLDGATQCVSCHDLAKRPPEYKCLDCHPEIRARLDAGRGLHTLLVGKDRTGRSCISCHSDHNGRTFNLIHWDAPVASFDHRRVGYVLDGKHASLGCPKCHQPALVSAPDIKSLPAKDLSRTYLGLSTQCATCHSDEHRGQMAAECRTCHDTTGWKNVARFNHDRTRFVLWSAHQKVACEKCHAKVDAPKPYVKYRDIPFQDCAPCHNDPHRGAFPSRCQSCHSVSSWKTVQETIEFNHATTRYRLEGKHAALACKACHPTSNFKAPVAHARCLDCHRKDVHQGQFVARADGGDCGACHTVEGFKPSTYTVASHAKAKFPLLDKHAPVACAKCHIPRGAETTYAFKSNDCAVCHEDVHKGQFQAAPYENRCESCHTGKGFKPSTFTMARHIKGRFPLEGSHGAVLCASCHQNRKDEYPAPPVQYHFERADCNACHADPHRGEFAERMTAKRPDGSPKGCEACHTLRDWKEIIGFDHSTTGFQLEGAHRAATCESCHKAPNLRTGLKDVAFKSAPKVCSGCHDDAHDGQFAGAGGATDCAGCHMLFKWKPSSFDHEKGSTYRLTGAHKGVTCRQCHLSAKQIEGKDLTTYRATPRECSACHAGRKAGGKQS
jgi:hypothetical protein